MFTPDELIDLADMAQQGLDMTVRQLAHLRDSIQKMEVPDLPGLGGEDTLKGGQRTGEDAPVGVTELEAALVLAEKSKHAWEERAGKAEQDLAVANKALSATTATKRQLREAERMRGETEDRATGLATENERLQAQLCEMHKRALDADWDTVKRMLEREVDGVSEGGCAA